MGTVRTEPLASAIIKVEVKQEELDIVDVLGSRPHSGTSMEPLADPTRRLLREKHQFFEHFLYSIIYGNFELCGELL